MAIFQEVGLSWAGREYTVAPDKVMGLIARIEDIITIDELAGRGVKRAKLAQAYGSALRYAGAKVTDDEIYAALFSVDAIEATSNAVAGLIALMIPPEQVRVPTDPNAKPAPEKPGKKKR